MHHTYTHQPNYTNAHIHIPTCRMFYAVSASITYVSTLHLRGLANRFMQRRHRVFSSV